MEEKGTAIGGGEFDNDKTIQKGELVILAQMKLNYLLNKINYYP